MGQKCTPVNNWSRDCKRVLKDIGQPDLWNVHGGVPIKTILKEAQDALMDAVITKWKRELLSQNKLRIYRTYKFDYLPENYVQMYLPKDIRSFIAKLRSSTLPLKIETGRFEHLEENKRLCIFCKCDPPSVETEYHFLFKCNAYAFLRIIFFNKVLMFYPKFIAFEETA